MKKKEVAKIPGKFISRAIKVVFFVAGGFLLFRNKEKIASFVKKQGFIVTAAYAVILAFIALIARLIMALNWILQQAR